jgi:hypothetical protein
MRCNPREVALSPTSRDNSTSNLQGTLFLKFGSHYCGVPPAPAGEGSTEGHLQVSDDIMNVCVAGRFRKDVLPVFQELIK